MSGKSLNNHVKAILVGVADYSAYAGTSDLPLSANDVDLMGKALVQGLRISPFYIWVKSTDSGCVTRESFLEGIKLFLRDIRPEDVLIFYFSGHGTVVRGRHYLLFSDGPLETQSVIDLFSKLKADKRILFLDTCMSGQYEVHEVGELTDQPAGEPSDRSADASSDQSIGGPSDQSACGPSDPVHWIDQVLDGGTAVFASSRPEERSGYNVEAAASLFTTFLWNAMTNRFYVRNGFLTLDRICDLVYQDAAAWNELHPDRAQHPVFRSSMAGTVTFRVTETHSYPQKQFGLEREDYIISEVKPLHSQIAKRFAVKVILKHAVTEAELIRINAEIVRSVRDLDIYKSEKEERRWSGKPATLIFTYYGYNAEDIAQSIHVYYTTWADECEDRTHWYRTDAHSKVAGGILIHTNPSYGWLRKLTEKYTGDRETVVRDTQNLMRKMIEDGEAVVQTYQEYRNGTLTSEKMLRDLHEICREIDRLYIAASNLPISPPELTKWSLLTSDVAGDLQDLSCILFWKNEKSCAEQDAIDDDRMNEAIARFHNDLDRFRQEEAHLRENRQMD